MSNQTGAMIELDPGDVPSWAAVPFETLFSAPAFLAATAILVATGLWMLWPIIGRQRD